MANKTGAVLCSTCHKLVARDETECPWCGAANPTLWGFAPLLSRVWGSGSDTVKLITMGCFGLYILSLIVDLRGTIDGLAGFDVFNLGAPSDRALYFLGMTGGYSWSRGHWWTLLTASWLHGSLLHIFFNMSWARSLGESASEIFGPARFFVLWTLSGVGGFLLSNVLFGSPTIGASASVFGVMGGLVAFGRKRGGSFGRNIASQVWTWAAVSLVFGFIMPSVNNAAHIGGLVTGFVLGWALPYAERSRETRVVRMLAMALAALTLLSLLASMVLNLGLLLPTG